jgi:serine/threonine protein kinase
MDPAEAQFYPGQVLGGRYRVARFRGSGAFSGVFEAVDTTSGREVAAKILSIASSRDPRAVAEFEEEKRLLGTLTACTNIVDLLDDGQHTMQLQVAGGPPSGVFAVPVPYMILELADASLADVIARRHAVAWAERLKLYRDVVKGTHQMHLVQIVNRDLKGDNALVYDAREPIAKLSDFGRSKDTRRPHLASKLDYQGGRGDPSFAPPEYLWLLGEASPVAMVEADLYLLGSVLFEIATGVGLTAFVFGNPMAIYAQALAVTDERQRAQLYQAGIATLREDYELAYQAFFSELPSAVRKDATTLLRQLSDPDPRARLPRKPFQGLPMFWDLQWLIRRVDILRARLAVPAQPRQRRRRIGPGQKRSSP